MPLRRPTLILETPRAAGERGHRFFMAKLDACGEVDAAECLAAAARHTEGADYLAASRRVSQVLRGQQRKDAPETLVAAGLPLLSEVQRAALRAHLDHCLSTWEERHSTESGAEQGLRVASPLLQSWEDEMYQILDIKTSARAGENLAEQPRSDGCGKVLATVLLIGLALVTFAGWHLWGKVQSYFGDGPNVSTTSEETLEQKLRQDRGWRELAALTGLKSKTPVDINLWQQRVTPYLREANDEDAAFIKGLSGENSRLDATLGRWLQSAPRNHTRQTLGDLREFAVQARCDTHEKAAALVKQWAESLDAYTKNASTPEVQESIKRLNNNLAKLPPPVPEWNVMTPVEVERWRLMSEWLATDPAFHKLVDKIDGDEAWGRTLGQTEITKLRIVAGEDMNSPEINLCKRLMASIQDAP